MTTNKDICTTYSKHMLDAFMSYPEFRSFHIIGKYYAQLLWDRVSIYALDLTDGSEFWYNDNTTDRDFEEFLSDCETFVMATEDSYLKEIHFPFELDTYTLCDGTEIEVVHAWLKDYEDGQMLNFNCMIGREDDFFKYINEGLEKQEGNAEHDDSQFYCFVDTQGKTFSELMLTNNGRAIIDGGLPDTIAANINEIEKHLMKYNSDVLIPLVRTAG